MFFKRSLSFIMVVLMLLSSCSFSAFAAEKETAAADSVVENYEYEAADRETGAIETEYAQSGNVDWEAVKETLRSGMLAHEYSIDLSEYNIPVNSTSENKFNEIFKHDLIDCFVKTNYSYTATSSGDCYINISPNYMCSAEESKNMRLQLYAAADALVADIDDSLTDVQKALVIHDRLILISEYDYYNRSYMKNTAYGPIIDGFGGNMGYALAYHYLLDLVGVESSISSFDAETASGVATNIVTINGKAYYVDTCLDDPSGDISGRVSHNYFMISGHKFLSNGVAISCDTTINNTEYDNYFWCNSQTAFQLLNGEIYYIDGSTKYLGRYSDRNGLKNLSYQWPASETTAWTGYYVRLACDGDYLYYSTPDAIYKYDPISGISSVAYKPDLSVGPYYYIFGFTYNNGKFLYEINNNPNFDYDTKSECQKTFVLKEEEKSDWTLENGVLTISLLGDMEDYDDPEIDSNTAPWHSRREEIKKVIIGEYTSSVGDFAFADLPNLESVVIGSRVERIGIAAFAISTAIKTIEIPASVRAIEDYAFNGCNSLGTVTLNKGLVTIGKWAFSGTALTEVIIPEGTTSIGDNAFARCNALNKVTIPESVNDIGLRVFLGNDFNNQNLDITIACKVGSCAEEYAFVNRFDIEYIDCKDFGKCGTDVYWCILDDGTLHIRGRGAMEYDGYGHPWYDLYQEDIKTVKIGDGVTTIGSGAFSDLPNLTAATVGNTVTTIEDYAFSESSELASINIPNSVTYIGSYAFNECFGLTAINIPGSVTEIGDYAFCGCTNLADLVLNEGLKIIGIGAFVDCYDLVSVIIPDGVTTIKSRAFGGNPTIGDITIPDSVTSMGDICDKFQYTIKVYSLDCCAAEYAREHWLYVTLKYIGAPIVTVDNYTVTVSRADELKVIRYAKGVHTTASSVKNAADCVTIDSKLITAGTTDGIYTREMPKGGYFTFWFRLNDNTEFLVPVDVRVTNDGPKVNLWSLEAANDFFIAKGHYETYSDVKANHVFRATSAKFGETGNYSYLLTQPGEHTVLIRYNSGESYYTYVDVEVPVPTFSANGVQLTVGGLKEVKAVRIAYGVYETVSQIKKAAGSRTFTQSVIKGNDSYTIQCTVSGVATVAIQYTSGYTAIQQVELTAKAPTYVVEGNKVTFSNVDDLYIIRYAVGTYDSASVMKNLSGAKYVKTKDMDENGNIVITLKNPGKYTFYYQYNEGSKGFIYETIG